MEVSGGKVDDVMLEMVGGDSWWITHVGNDSVHKWRY